MIDPLAYGVELPYGRIFHPLGFPLLLSTNSTGLLDAASQSWDGFPSISDTAPLEVRIAVASDGPECPPRPPVFRGQRHLLAIVSDPWNYAICDHTRGFAFGWLAASTVRERAFVCYHFLEAIAFHLLTQLYVTPVHAACVSRESGGLLLCGESGAGKSCLAYACARHGWTYLSDNDSWLVRAAGTALLRGDPRRIRFRESAVALFPETSGYELELRADGKRSLILPLQTLPGFSTAFETEVKATVLLRRGNSDSLAAARIPQGAMMNVLESFIPRYSEDVSAAHRSSLEGLASLPAYELRYSDWGTAAEKLAELLKAA